MQETCVTELRFISLTVRKSYITFVPAVLLTAGIAILSLTESTHMPAVSLNDKLVHAFMYLLLAVSWVLPTIKQGSQSQNFQTIKPYVVTCVATTAYGSLLELLQHYCTHTRSGEWFDLLADFLGALIGVGLVALLQIINHKS